MNRQDAVLVELLRGDNRDRPSIQRALKAPVSGRCLRGLVLGGWVLRLEAADGGIEFALTPKGRAYAERMGAR